MLRNKKDFATNSAKVDWYVTRNILENGTPVKLKERDLDYSYMIEGDTVFLFFHKSKSLKDWFHDFFMKTVTYNGRKYHQGFFELATDAFYDIEKRFHIKNKKFVVYGHSLGGAVSSILTDFFHDYKIEVKRHATFGELANAKSKDLKEIRKESIRYEQGFDFFSRMYFWIYKHYGNYQHLPSRGTWKKNHNYNWMENYEN